MKNSVLKWKILAGVVAIMVLFNAGNLLAQNTGMVQILKSSSEGGKLVINPPDIYVKRNTVVVWMNGFKGEEIQVSFKDGKAAMDVSFSPEFRGFCLDSKSCYVTSFIPYAATSSLQFTKVGTFYYSVSNPTGKISAKGKVVVRDM